jgi:hypothetical protein
MNFTNLTMMIHLVPFMIFLEKYKRDGRLRRHPRQFGLPKAFQTQIYDLSLSFLTLPNFRVQAPDVVSH